MIKHAYNKKMFDRMRARRGRITKRIEAKTPKASGQAFRSHVSSALDASSEAGSGNTGIRFNPTVWIYLMLLIIFLVLLFGGMFGDGIRP